MKLDLPDEAATVAFAGRLAKVLKAPMLVALRGPLGAGKTTFVGGVLHAMGHKGVVPSPTFAMVNEYRRLRPRAVHMDLYRATPLDLPGLALEEYFDDRSAVCLVEWPENAGGLLPVERIDIALDHARRGRTLVMTGKGEKAAAAVRALC